MSLQALLFLALFGGSLILALVRHPIYGLYAYLLAFYGFPHGRWWGADVPDLRWSLIAAAVTLIGILRLERPTDKPSWYANPPAILLIVFTIWLWIQQFWALSSVEHAFLATTYTKFLILFYLMHRLLTDEKSVFYFSLAHVAGCAYYAWLAYRVTAGGRIENIGGPNMSGASEFSAHLSTGLILAGVLLFRTRGAIRVLIFFAIPIILNGIILTQSRGSFLGLFAGGLTVLYLWPRAFRKTAYSAGILAVVLFFMLATDLFWERMETIVNAVQREEMDRSAESRWVLIDAQWKMFSLNPIRGSGHRGTAILSPRYLDESMLSKGGRSSHNTVMTILVEQGILGSAIYLAIALWVALRLRRLKKLARTGIPTSLSLYNAAIGGALVSILVAGQFVDVLRLEVTIWYIVLLVVIYRLAEEAEQNESQSGAPDGDFNAELASKNSTAA